MGELGDLLRETREEKGISLAQVEETTHIREKYLEALEEENFAAIPNEICVKGFLRNYSLYLGLDPVETKSRYWKVTGQTDIGRQSGMESVGQRTPNYQWIELSLGQVKGTATRSIILVSSMICSKWSAPLRRGLARHQSGRLTRTNTGTSKWSDLGRRDFDTLSSSTKKVCLTPSKWSDLLRRDFDPTTQTGFPAKR